MRVIGKMCKFLLVIGVFMAAFTFVSNWKPSRKTKKQCRKMKKQFYAVFDR